MAKRGNGEGSIYQRASDGRWVGAYTATDGRRRFIYANSRSEVRDRLVVAQREAQQGISPAPARLTVDTFFDQWLDAVKPSLRPRTFSSYSDLLRLHVRPLIGKVALAKLTPREVQSLVNDRLAAGLSPRTVQYVHAVLRRALGHAEKWGLVGRNVARLVDGPRVPHAEIHPLTPDEARQLLAFVRGSPDEALYTVAIAIGLRQGEALGLRWVDLDLENARASVVQTVITVKHEVQIGDPKTAKGTRAVELDPATVAALREHRKRQATERLQMGAGWTDHGLVFCHIEGGPLHPERFSRTFADRSRQLGLPSIRLHDLRHTWATLALETGVHPKVVQERLGHANISITMDIYSHVTEALHSDAAAKVAGVIFGTV